MKITPETKISEIPPKEYELIPFEIDWSGNKPDDIKLTLVFKKKEEKNFEWYVKEYIKPVKSVTFTPEQWRFEDRIGLFRFICEDIKVNWYLQLSFIYDNYLDFKYKIQEICPESFLKSLL